MKAIKINLMEFLSAISLALDLAEFKTMEHARRTAYTATKIAKVINPDKEFQKRVYLSSLLHDIGVTESLKDSHELDELIKGHSERGSEIVNNIPVDKSISDIIKYHHEKWDGSGPFKLDRDNIPIENRIIFFADAFDLNFDHRNLNFEKKPHKRMGNKQHKYLVRPSCHRSIS